MADELLPPIVIEEEDAGGGAGIAVVAGGGAAAAAFVAVADPLFPLLGEEEDAALPVLAAGQAAHPLAVADVPLALAGGTALAGGLLPEPEALAAVAAVVGADPQPAHLAALHQLHAHAHAQQQWPAAGPAPQQPHGAALGASVALAAPGLAAHPALARLQQQHTPAVQAQPGPAEGEGSHGALPSLCPSPSVELSLDGQLPSPE